MGLTWRFMLLPQSRLSVSFTASSTILHTYAFGQMNHSYVVKAPDGQGILSF